MKVKFEKKCWFRFSSPVEIRNSASLPLQILLFVNVYLAPIWMVSSLQFFYVYAQDETAKHNQIVLGAVLFVIACPLEICRLCLGYSGNLREDVRFILYLCVYVVVFEAPYKLHMYRENSSSAVKKAFVHCVSTEQRWFKWFFIVFDIFLIFAIFFFDFLKTKFPNTNRSRKF